MYHGCSQNNLRFLFQQPLVALVCILEALGIGMVLALKAEDADKAIAALEAMGEKAWLIGSIAAGEKGVDVC